MITPQTLKFNAKKPSKKALVKAFNKDFNKAFLKGNIKKPSKLQRICLLNLLEA